MKLKRLLSLFLALGFVAALGGGPLATPVHASSLKVCGQVTAYVKPTLVATGVLTINGVTFTVGIGAALPAGVAVGADLCADLTTNALGLVTGAAITANAHVHVLACGDITAYAAATATSTGLLRVGSDSFTIGLGSTLPASVHAGANLCLDLTLDGFGRIAGGSVSVNVSSTLRICGTVTAYVAATATSAGSITVAGRSLVIAIGATLPASVHVGANLCLTLTLNGFGQVSGGGAIVNVSSTLDVCGQVTAYVAATATTDGYVAVAQTGLSIAAATAVDSRIAVSAFVRLHLTLDAFGRISDATVLKVGVSVADACTAAPSPSSGPGASSEPGTSPGPGSSTGPGFSPEPTAGPGQSEAPGATPSPGGGGEGDQGTVAHHDGPSGEVTEPACLWLEEHDHKADQEDREVDDANDVAHRDRREVHGGAVDPDDPQTHGALAEGLPRGHSLGNQEVPEVHEAREESGGSACERRSLAAADQKIRQRPEEEHADERERDRHQVVEDLSDDPAPETRDRVPQRDVVRGLDADGVELGRVHRIIVARPMPPVPLVARR